MIIGICGKSGSGKTTICKQLEELGAYVIDADVIARNIMCGCVLEKVKDEFPECFENGVLNRRKLGSCVFSDESKLEILNNITHPVIRNEIQNRINCAESEYDIIVVDAAVMIEAGMLDMFDFTVAVIAADNMRKKRIMARDGISESLASSRISAQKDDAFYIDNTDFYVVNNGDSISENVGRDIIERGRRYAALRS